MTILRGASFAGLKARASTGPQASFREGKALAVPDRWCLIGGSVRL